MKVKMTLLEVTEDILGLRKHRDALAIALSRNAVKNPGRVADQSLQEQFTHADEVLTRLSGIVIEYDDPYEQDEEE